MPYKVANFLELDNPQDTALGAGLGADITILKGHWDWKSASATEDYIEYYLKAKIVCLPN